MQTASPPDHLLELVPLTARTILHPGCDTVTWWRTYRALNPAVRIFGMKDLASDPGAAIELGPDAQQHPLALSEGVDCIVYDCVAGAVDDPWTMLERLLELLNPDGAVVIRIANPDYWRHIEALLRGTARGRPASPAGMSLTVVQTELERLGLTICDTFAPTDDAEGAAFAEAMLPSLRALGIDPAEFASRSAASSVVIRAIRPPRLRLDISGTMLSPVGGVSDVRVVLPLRALATDPVITTRITNIAQNDQPPDHTGRIFVLHRPAMMGPEGAAVLNRLADAGYVIVTEFDDLPDIFEMMRHGGALGFYGAHAIQTSTITLAERLREYCPEIAVFPNAITELPEVANFREPNRLTLFFGALNRERDWQTLMPVLNSIAAIAGDRLRFEVVHDNQFFEALETPHKHFTPTCDYPTYLSLLGKSEISFMPLLDTRFSRAKSDLKYIEAASCRVVALASHVVYGNSIDDGRTGFLFRDPVELRARLMRLIALPALARDIADAGRQYVIDERMLTYQVRPRAAWYRSLWARRAMLEEARRERMARMG